MTRRVETSHLPKDAPNILIVLLDDVGLRAAGHLGGEVHTPTLSRHRQRGHQLQHASTPPRSARRRARRC